jgi:hypothetical protein
MKKTISVVTKNKISFEKYIEVEKQYADSVATAIEFLKEVSKAPLNDINELFTKLKATKSTETHSIALRRCVFVLSQVVKKGIEVPESIFDEYYSLGNIEKKTREILKPKQPKSSTVGKKVISNKVHIEEEKINNGYDNNKNIIAVNEEEARKRLEKLLSTIKMKNDPDIKMLVCDLDLNQINVAINALSFLIVHVEDQK